MKTGNHKNTFFNIYVDNKGMKLTVSRRMAKLLTVSRESPTPLETSSKLQFCHKRKLA